MATGASTARPGDHPDRRPPRRAGADQAALVHRVAAGHQARPRGHQQDGPRRLSARRSSRRSQPTTRTSPRGSTCPTCTSSRISALKGDNVVDAEREHAVVRRLDADAPSGERLHRLRPQPRRLPLPRAVRQLGRISTSAASAARSPRASSARATRSWRCRRGRRAA